MGFVVRMQVHCNEAVQLPIHTRPQHKVRGRMHGELIFCNTKRYHACNSQCVLSWVHLRWWLYHLLHVIMRQEVRPAL